MFKFLYSNTKNSNERIIKIFNLPLYYYSQNDNLSIQTFCLNIIRILKNTDIKTFYLFNIPILKTVINGIETRYYLFNYQVKSRNSAIEFYNKYLKNIEFEYDDIYILNSNIGELYLFAAYLLKSFLKKNNSNKPLFIATKKYHIDIISIYFPDAKFIYIKDKIRDIKKNATFNIKNHKVFLIFDFSHFARVCQEIRDNEIGATHYFNDIINTLGLTGNDCLKPSPNISKATISNATKKIKETNLNLNKFIILMPEALSCTSISTEVWLDIAKKLINKGYDIYFNIVNEENKKVFSEYKFADLNIQELFYLASFSKAIISLRSGLTEFLLPTGIPNITIYSQFKNRNIFKGITLEKIMASFSMQKIPYVNTKLIKEINSENQDENNLTNEVITQIESILLEEK